MKDFYFHYSRNSDGMVVNVDGKDHATKNVHCTVMCSTEWREGQDPRLVITGCCTHIAVEGDAIWIL